MEEKYNLENAINFANKLEKETSVEKVDIINLAISLKIFGEQKDETNFKRIVDKYVNLLKNYSSEDLINKNRKENPYSFLEFICSAMDSSFTKAAYSGTRDYNREKLEIGPTRSLFHKLYGSYID